jgi:hypothetical protein
VIRWLRELGFFLGCALVVTVCGGHNGPSEPPRPSPPPTTLPAVPIAHSATQAVWCDVGAYRVATDPVSARKRGLLDCTEKP